MGTVGHRITRMVEVFEQFYVMHAVQRMSSIIWQYAREVSRVEGVPDCMELLPCRWCVLLVPDGRCKESCGLVV